MREPKCDSCGVFQKHKCRQMGVWLVLLLENAASVPIAVDSGGHYVGSSITCWCQTPPTTLKGSGISRKHGRDKQMQLHQTWKEMYLKFKEQWNVHTPHSSARWHLSWRMVGLGSLCTWGVVIFVTAHKKEWKILSLLSKAGHLPVLPQRLHSRSMLMFKVFKILEVVPKALTIKAHKGPSGPLWLGWAPRHCGLSMSAGTFHRLCWLLKHFPRSQVQG